MTEDNGMNVANNSPTFSRATPAATAGDSALALGLQEQKLYLMYLSKVLDSVHRSGVRPGVPIGDLKFTVADLNTWVREYIAWVESKRTLTQEERLWRSLSTNKWSLGKFVGKYQRGLLLERAGRTANKVIYRRKDPTQWTAEDEKFFDGDFDMVELEV